MIIVMDEFWKDVRDLSLDLGIKPETSRKWQTNEGHPQQDGITLLLKAVRE